RLRLGAGHLARWRARERDPRRRGPALGRDARYRARLRVHSVSTPPRGRGAGLVPARTAPVERLPQPPARALAALPGTRRERVPVARRVVRARAVAAAHGRPAAESNASANSGVDRRIASSSSVMSAFVLSNRGVER